MDIRHGESDDADGGDLGTALHSSRRYGRPEGAAQAPTVIGVELGGTKIMCSLARGRDYLETPIRVPTTDPESTLSAVEHLLDRWTAARDVAAIGVASFGPIDVNRASPNYGHVKATTKVGWEGADIAGRIGRRYGIPVAFDTDVNGAALAEGRWGAARGLSSWTYITVGTGVGAGIVTNGRPVAGASHSEAGHMLVRRTAGDDWGGHCSFHGDCVEGLVSGPAIAARLGRNGGDVAATDPVWSLVADTLAGMIHNLVMTASPERVLLGGGVVGGRPELLPLVRARLDVSLNAYGAVPEIVGDLDAYVVRAGLGDDAGPLGSLALALDACSGTEQSLARRADDPLAA